MDGQRFDRLAKALAAAVSRRGSLRVLAAGLASVGGAALGWRGAAAQREVPLGGRVGPADTDPTCERKAAISNDLCAINHCTPDPECYCTKTVYNKKRCVRYNGQVLRCPLQDECDRNKDCRKGQVCVQVGGCCRHPARHRCVALCGS